MWWSKNLYYKTPYSVTGTIKLTGSEQAPKVIYVQIELSERRKQSNIVLAMVVTKKISTLNDCESSGTTYEALVMRTEEQPQVINMQLVIGKSAHSFEYDKEKCFLKESVAYDKE